MNLNYLMTVQAEYLANPSSLAIYHELFKAIYETALINIKSHYHGDPEDLATMGEDICIVVMGRYKKGWQARRNLGAVVALECRKRLHDPRYNERGDDGEMPIIEDSSGPIGEAIEREAELTQYAKSEIYESIMSRALHAESYQSFLAYFAKIRSLNWIWEHIDDMNRIWELQRG